MKHNGSLSGSFPISNNVKQGCILAPTLFSIFFSIMIREAKLDLPDGIYIRFWTDFKNSNWFVLSSKSSISKYKLFGCWVYLKKSCGIANMTEHIHTLTHTQTHSHTHTHSHTLTHTHTHTHTHYQKMMGVLHKFNTRKTHQISFSCPVDQTAICSSVCWQQYGQNLVIA